MERTRRVVGEREEKEEEEEERRLASLCMCNCCVSVRSVMCEMMNLDNAERFNLVIVRAMGEDQRENAHVLFCRLAI